MKLPALPLSLASKHTVFLIFLNMSTVQSAQILLVRVIRNAVFALCSQTVINHITKLIRMLERKNTERNGRNKKNAQTL